MSENREVKRLEARAHGMLPGVAGICLLMGVMAVINAFAAVRGVYGAGPARYGVLGLCTLLAAGVLGLMRLKRWGWSLVLGGCLTLALGYFFVFEKTHQGPYLLEGLFAMVFFLYLVRTEVRERLV